MKTLVTVYCISCNKKRLIDGSKNNINTYQKLYPKCSSCSRIGLTNSGQFRKGFVAWNKGTKGVMKPNSGTFKKGIRYSPETEFKKGQVSDENNSRWKGDKVGYFGLHTWVQRKLGKASKCTFCNIKNASRYEWANKSYQYKRDISDWMELCVDCHRKHDAKNGWGLATKKFPELRKIS